MHSRTLTPTSAHIHTHARTRRRSLARTNTHTHARTHALKCSNLSVHVRGVVTFISRNILLIPVEFVDIRSLHDVMSRSPTPLSLSLGKLLTDIDLWLPMSVGYWPRKTSVIERQRDYSIHRSHDHGGAAARLRMYVTFGTTEVHVTCRERV